MVDTIYTRILSGELPSHRVYEDPLVYAFLDIFPLSEGHTLVIPKEPAETLDQLSDASSAAIGAALPRICRAVKAATGCAGYNILQNNGATARQAVMHVHFHVIPKSKVDDGLIVRWSPGKLDDAAGAALAARIAAQI